MSQMQPVMFDAETRSFDVGRRRRGLTRDEMVRMEGAHAAYCGYCRHDNPYRSQSADGVSWRAGFDGAKSN
ncbi:hypothetical protein ACLNGM_06445 [Aureimonas phyllosphaerae]|uniref:hypothetical protein n=1 Tax=Aureimonas phyllosphaerae TaxID=1166078 RepID=UPI003A5C1A52